MTATQGTRRIRRIVASVLVVAMLAGAIVTDQAGLGSRSERYAGSPAYAYLTETMECLSYGWLHWIGYWLGAQFSDADSASGQYRRACVAVAQRGFRRRGAVAAGPHRFGTRAASGDGKRGAAPCSWAACDRPDGDAPGAAQAAGEAATLDGENAQLQQLSYQFSLDAGDARGAAAALSAYATLTRDNTLYAEIADLYLEAGDYEELWSVL